MDEQVVLQGGQDDNAQQGALAQAPAASREEPAGAPAAVYQPAADGVVQTVSVRVEYELRPSTTSMSFQGPYVHTGNQVHRPSGSAVGITEAPALIAIADASPAGISSAPCPWIL